MVAQSGSEMGPTERATQDRLVFFLGLAQQAVELGNTFMAELYTGVALGTSKEWRRGASNRPLNNYEFGFLVARHAEALLLARLRSEGRLVGEEPRTPDAGQSQTDVRAKE